MALDNMGKAYNAREGLNWKPVASGHNKKWFDQFSVNLKEIIEANFKAAMQKLAKAKNMHKEASWGAKKSLGLYRYIWKEHQPVTEASSKHRIEKSKTLLFWMKKDQGSVPVFSNKNPYFNKLD